MIVKGIIIITHVYMYNNSVKIIKGYVHCSCIIHFTNIIIKSVADPNKKSAGFLDGSNLSEGVTIVL